jgi:hypothetical protein
LQRHRFEGYTGFRDFKVFLPGRRSLLAHLAEQESAAPEKEAGGTPRAHLKRFFRWLAGQPGWASPDCVLDARILTCRKRHGSLPRGAKGSRRWNRSSASIATPTKLIRN